MAKWVEDVDVPLMDFEYEIDKDEWFNMMERIFIDYMFMIKVPYKLSKDEDGLRFGHVLIEKDYKIPGLLYVTVVFGIGEDRYKVYEVRIHVRNPRKLAWLSRLAIAVAKALIPNAKSEW